MLEHIEAVLVVKGQDDLAVRVRGEGVAFRLQFLFDGTEAVQLAVAGHAVRAPEKGLHALRRQAHDGQPAEAQQAELGLADPLVVRPAGGGTQQILGESFLGQIMPGIAHDAAHLVTLLTFLQPFFPERPKKKDSPLALCIGRVAVLNPRCHLSYRSRKHGIRSLFRTRSPLKRCRCNARPAAPLLPRRGFRLQLPGVLSCPVPVPARSQMPGSLCGCWAILFPINAFNS